MRSKGGSRALPKARWVSQEGDREGAAHLQQVGGSGKTETAAKRELRNRRGPTAIQTGLLCCLRNASPVPGPNGLDSSRLLTMAFTFI